MASKYGLLADIATLGGTAMADKFEQQEMVDQAKALGAQAKLAGIDREMPGVGMAVAEGLQGGASPENMFNLMAQNPDINPAAAAQMEAAQAQGMQDQALAMSQEQRKQAKEQRDAISFQQEQFKAAETQTREQLARLQPFKERGREIEAIREMKTLAGTEGKAVAPGQAKGIYEVLQTRLLNSLRIRMEAGALQKEELKFFQSVLPDFTAWSGMSQAERVSKLSEMEHWYMQGLEDDLAFSGIDYSADAFAGAGRSYEDMMAPLPPGLDRGISPDTQVPQAQGPSGEVAPFGAFMQQMGF
tara:strand:+ start:4012 stop:4914 length:903 start_codon:yes stop_codon:yes gene_type:complete